MVPWGRSLLSIQDLVTVFPLAYTSRSSWAKENKKQGLPQLAAYLGRLVTLLTVFEHCFIALLYSPASCGTCYCSPRDFPSPSSYSIGMCEAKARSAWTKSRSADCFVPWLLSQLIHGKFMWHFPCCHTWTAISTSQATTANFTRSIFNNIATT